MWIQGLMSFIFIRIPRVFPFRFLDWIHPKLHIRLSDRGVLQGRFGDGFFANNCRGKIRISFLLRYRETQRDDRSERILEPFRSQKKVSK